jgi:hypothetical protein
VVSAVRREIRRVTGSGEPAVVVAEPLTSVASSAASLDAPAETIGTAAALTRLAADYRKLPEVARRRGAQVTVGVGQGEASYWMLTLAGLLGGSRRHPALSTTVIPTVDHNLRSFADQQAVHRLVDEALTEWESPAR